MSFPQQPGTPSSPYAPPGGGIPATQVGGANFAPGGVYAQGPRAGGEYEFVPEHDRVIGGAGGWMTFVGVMLVIFGALGVLGVVGAYMQLSANVITEPMALRVLLLGGGGVVLLLVIGGLTLSAGSGYRRVANTSGNDIANLMQAMISLRRLYFVYGIMVIAYVALIVIAIVMQVQGGAEVRSLRP